MNNLPPKMKPKLLVILGAGSSVELGMPMVGDIDAKMRGWAKRSADAPVPNYFDLVWENREQAAGKKEKPEWAEPIKPNYERCLGDLHALMNGTLPSVGGASYSRALCRMVGISGRGHTQKRAVSSEVNGLLKVLLRELERCFRGRCVEFKSENGRQRSDKFERYCALVAALRARFDLGVYNLNHDTVALTALGDIYTGFGTSGSFESAGVHSRREWDFLYHLHGSVHFSLGRAEKMDEHIPASYDICWLADLDDGPCGQHRSVWLPKGSSDNRDVVASTLVAGGWKLDQIQAEPFQTFYSTLPRHAHEADAILIAGYGFGDEHVNSVLKNVLKARAGRRPPVLVLDKKGPMERLHQCEKAQGCEWREYYGRSAWLGDLAKTLDVLCPRFVRAEQLVTELAGSDGTEMLQSGDYDRCVEPAYPVAVWFGGMRLKAELKKDEFESWTTSLANWLLRHLPARSEM